MRPRNALVLAIALLIAAPASLAAQDADMKAKMKEAMSAAVPSIADAATLMDWDGTIMKEGSNGWTCLPGMRGPAIRIRTWTDRLTTMTGWWPDRT